MQENQPSTVCRLILSSSWPIVSGWKKGWGTRGYRSTHDDWFEQKRWAMQGGMMPKMWVDVWWLLLSSMMVMVILNKAWYMMNGNGESFWPSMKGHEEIMMTDARGCFLQGIVFCHKILFKLYAQTSFSAQRAWWFKPSTLSCFLRFLEHGRGVVEPP